MKKIIWISWRLWCWKSIISEYLSNKLWLKIYENSDILKQEAKNRWIIPNREDLINIAIEWQEIHWSQIIVEKLLDSIDWNWIISWIRLFEQARYLKENSLFKLIYIESLDEVIFDRIISRNKFWDPMSKEYFEKILKKDWNDLDKLKNNADFVIENNGSLEDLHKKLDVFIDKILKS